MKYRWSLAVLGLAAVLSGAPALGHDDDGQGKGGAGGCKAEAEKLCPGMHPGDGKFGPCMKEHLAELPKECQELAAKKMSEKGGKGKAACGADAAKLCPDAKPGDGKFRDCMEEHKAELSQGCRDFIASKHQEMAGKGKEACGADGAKFCAGMKPGDGKFGPCMKEHKDELSEACRKFMSAMGGMRKRHDEKDGGVEKGGDGERE